LPDSPSLEWLRKQAKRRLGELRQSDRAATLANAQYHIAKEYGFSSWRALKAHIDLVAVEGQLFNAARNGKTARLAALLDEDPTRLQVRNQPYAWTLLHAAAHQGQLAVVDLLLERGLDANERERGDNTCAMHWAAAAGHVKVVRRLAEAGGDVIGSGDDHELEVVGWATCWDGCDDAAHRAVAEFLVRSGARHHIFSAIAMNLAEEVRRIVAADPASLNKRMSRNEDHQLPLHFAVRRKRAEMVALLLDLGADPLAVDGSGYPAAVYAADPGIDRRAMEAIRAMTSAELASAGRGHREPRVMMMDIIAALSLGDLDRAAQLWALAGRETGNSAAGVLHVMAKRGDTRAVRWLLDHGADPNAYWAHWDAEVTPLHLAALHGHEDIVRALLASGADPGLRDSKHDGDAMGWAEHFGQHAIVRLFEAHAEGG
jgi:ankyrin repeat protein